MTEFPPGTTIRVSSLHDIHGAGRITFMATAGGPEPARAIEHFGEQLWSVDLMDADLMEAGVLEPLARHRVRFLSPPDLGRVSGLAPALRSLRPVFVLAADRQVFTNTRFLTSLALPVHIDPDTPVDDAAELARVLDYYLRDALLHVPIEPFHSLLRTRPLRRPFDLWDTEYERAGVHLHVADDGAIAFSPAWHRAGSTLGTLGDSWSTIAASPAYRAHLDVTGRIFAERRACMFCPHLQPCGGFLKRIRPERDCDAWLALFGTLGAETGRARQLLRQYYATAGTA